MFNETYSIAFRICIRAASTNKLGNKASDPINNQY